MMNGILSLSLFISIVLYMKTEATDDTLANINKLKEHFTNTTGIDRPEDIPVIADWMKTCEKTIGRTKFRAVKASQAKLITCISKHIEMSKIEIEVKESMEKGELEVVFKKYCGRRDDIMDCIDSVIEPAIPCLNDQQLKDYNMTRDAVDAGIDFVCHENGDRIALFMSEDGIKCVQDTQEEITTCIKAKIPEVQQLVDEKFKSLKINKYFINDENCKSVRVAHKCIVDATIKCDDPTPSNILDSLITQALKITPCYIIDEAAQQDQLTANSSSSGFYKHFRALLPHVLTVVAAGLTAAQLLL